VCRDSGRLVWTVAHVHALRALSALTDVDLQLNWTETELEALTVEPVPIQLANIHFIRFGKLGPRTALLVCRLTGLRSLRFYDLLHGVDLCFLTSLPALEEVELRIFDERLSSTHLVDALSHCTRIRKLDVDHPTMQQQDLTRLLHSLPALSDLTLRNGHLLDDFSFFIHASHLQRTLFSFVLPYTYGAILQLTEERHLCYLRELRALRFLDVGRSVTFASPQLRAEFVQQVHPRSKELRRERDLWPDLQHVELHPELDARSS
jgi:hypothetical protein